MIKFLITLLLTILLAGCGSSSSKSDSSKTTILEDGGKVIQLAINMYDSGYENLEYQYDIYDQQSFDELLLEVQNQDGWRI